MMGSMGNGAACLRDPWWILGKTKVLLSCQNVFLKVSIL